MLKSNPNPNASQINWHKWHEIQIPSAPDTGPCRYCKHSQWEHRPDEKGNKACRDGMYDLKCKPCAVELIVPNNYKINVCPCMEYAPGENLAYLEWKSKRGF